MERLNKKRRKPQLKNDFERMVPEFHKGSVIYGEHLVRYLTARQLVKGKVVLDIASGSGYGSHALAQAAKKVIGVDILADAVGYAQDHFMAPNIEYRQGDGVSIPVKDASIDVVVSFETIEHIKDYRAFMTEVKRVLKPNGLFLLSTPNDTEFAEGNHFHIHEFVHDELQQLAKDYFSDIKEYFQADWIYTGVHELKELTDEWSGKTRLMNVAPLNIDQVLYFFMLCANREISERIESLGAVSEHYSARKLQTKEALTQQHIANITLISDDRLDYARGLEEELRKKEKELEKWRPLQNSLIGRAYNRFRKN